MLKQSDDIKCKLTGVEDSEFLICRQVATPVLFLDKLLKISIYIVVLKILEIVSVLRQMTEYIQLPI